MFNAHIGSYIIIVIIIARVGSYTLCLLPVCRVLCVLGYCPRLLWWVLFALLFLPREVLLCIGCLVGLICPHGDFLHTAAWLLRGMLFYFYLFVYTLWHFITYYFIFMHWIYSLCFCLFALSHRVCFHLLYVLFSAVIGD